MKSKELYMKDSSTLRIALCTYVVVMEIFKLVWVYLISPISYTYLAGFQKATGPTIVSLSLSIIPLFVFVFLSFLNLEKHWKKYYIFIGCDFIINMLYCDVFYFIDTRIRYEAGMISSFESSYLSLFFMYLLIYGIPALLCFLVLTEKKIFKYLVIICFVLFTCNNIVNVVTNLTEVSDSSAVRWVTVYGSVLKDWEEPFYYITNTIQSIPTLNLAFLILSFFIKEKKLLKPITQKNSFVPYTPNNYPINNQQQGQGQTVYAQPLPTQPMQMKYCPKCGEKTDVNHRFCKKCGNPFPQI